MMKNSRIQQWFENGEFKEALLGCGEYRIPDHTFLKEHDRLLIVHQLINWVAENRDRHSANYFTNLIISLLEDTFNAAVDILLCYFISNKQFPMTLDCREIQTVLKEEIIKHGNDIVSNERLRDQLIRLNSYMPGIFKALEGVGETPSSFFILVFIKITTYRNALEQFVFDMLSSPKRWDKLNSDERRHGGVGLGRDCCHFC